MILSNGNGSKKCSFAELPETVFYVLSIDMKIFSFRFDLQEADLEWYQQSLIVTLLFSRSHSGV